MPQQLPSGSIYTMADDLKLAKDEYESNGIYHKPTKSSAQPVIPKPELNTVHGYDHKPEPNTVQDFDMQTKFDQLQKDDFYISKSKEAIVQKPQPLSKKEPTPIEKEINLPKPIPLIQSRTATPTPIITKKEESKPLERMPLFVTQDKYFDTNKEKLSEEELDKLLPLEDLSAKSKTMLKNEIPRGLPAELSMPPKPAMPEYKIPFDTTSAYTPHPSSKTNQPTPDFTTDADTRGIKTTHNIPQDTPEELFDPSIKESEESLTLKEKTDLEKEIFPEPQNNTIQDPYAKSFDVDKDVPLDIAQKEIPEIPYGLPIKPPIPSQPEKSRMPEYEIPQEKPEELFGPLYQADKPSIESESLKSTPISPLPIKPERKKFKFPNFRSSKFILSSIAIIVGIVVIGTIIYLVTSSGKQEIVTPEPEETKPKPPNALVIPDFVLDTTITDARETNLKNAIAGLGKTEYPKESITYVPMHMSRVSVQGEVQYLDLRTFLEGLNIKTPKKLFDTVESTFMLYVYSPGDEERTVCQNHLVSEKECYGPRLGLILKAKSDKEQDLLLIKTEWEKMIASSNLDALILNKLIQTPSGEPTFAKNTYQYGAEPNIKSIETSYLNLAMPSYENLWLSTTSIDFAIINDLLLVGTSKNSTLKMLDRITK